MANLAKDDFKKVLGDVRKAYRLLYMYQRRVMDLVKFIGDYYSFSYRGGWPCYSDPAPNRGRGYLSNWAWDWLNMYYYDFRFQAKNVGGIEIQLSIRILGDTGFFDASDSAKKRDVAKFNSVGDSKTKFIFMIGKGEWQDSKLLPYEALRSDAPDTIYSGEKGSNKCTVIKIFDLENFVNEDETRKRLDEFTSLCNDYGIVGFNE